MGQGRNLKKGTEVPEDKGLFSIMFMMFEAHKDKEGYIIFIFSWHYAISLLKMELGVCSCEVHL